MVQRRVMVLAAVVALGAAAFGVPGASGAEEPREAGPLLKKEPKDAKEVAAIRGKAKHGEEVVVIGRIGGRQNPWIKGAAAFSIVDRSLKSCDEIPGDTCPTPWDYCCEADLAKSTVFVKFVGADGKVVKQDARKLLKVKELQTVVIKGTAQRDKQDNVVILASGLFLPTDKRVAP